MTPIPQSLTIHLRNKQFAGLIEERTQKFVGRQFIFDGIDNLLKDPSFPSGYILIKGEPGVGKTSIIAKLVKDHNWIHHFNIKSQGITSTSAFLRNICAQLIIRYKLDYTELPIEADLDSGILSTLIFDSATAENKPIVMLIDALDEAEDAFQLSSDLPNKLLLPPLLPNGVFFVITTREQANYHLVVDREKTIYLNDDNPQNLADVALYIENYLRENFEPMSRAITLWNVTPADFVKIITEKSQGNFMYLVFVLRDICDGQITVNNFESLQSLPAGLKNYYQQHWTRMKELERQIFEDIYEPVVGTLAAAKEPISLIKISEISKVALPHVKQVLGRWQEFLNELPDEQYGSLFRLYHNSFRDFLDEEVNLTSYHLLFAKKAEDKIQ